MEKKTAPANSGVIGQRNQVKGILGWSRAIGFFPICLANQIVLMEKTGLVLIGPNLLYGLNFVNS